MDSIFNILSQKDFDQPPEARAIKQYVQQTFETDVEVRVRDKDILIIGRSAALIGSLRLQSLKLQRAADTDKRLVFRVG